MNLYVGTGLQTVNADNGVRDFCISMKWRILSAPIPAYS